MQYEPTLSRGELIALATKTYFGNVDAKNMEATLDCFHDEALFCVQTAFTRHAGKAEIRRMFEDFFASYETIIHRDFNCTVDEANGRIAASFIAELHDADGRVTLLNNTNFWRVRPNQPGDTAGARFQEVYVYMSGANVLT
ncbi:nuclear transport factor 2 family protein [Croceicoccus ponticola]|uniref:Nuclear transport factor 2 family protein n=1 Tax=Croceicoccus ponticola TaxID=2217664 RepID=A0A437GWS9_9SPHN|nr:nuclear transport factor 2 family protein [Croceicoccus ponticola]RVQ66583.1 nuclear transport factor 2 family protein [Croceicoccus ponticola]